MRRATVRTAHDRPGVVAAALRPDNTAEMSTRVDGRTVVTTIERDSTGGLRTTVDDYVTNLQVAQRVTDTTIQP
ncbi:KEOPS complex Pcc1-like subunit [Halobacteriales archaeon QS_8_69_73]|jgi:tRNA threonylcarbamoyladenosine modification (KEOPS) complex  Pcc1 subunit|nr:MAG: KEOPS complex Pcc1-like subunit [Halobacteriales archaeon QS_8_69_73]